MSKLTTLVLGALVTACTAGSTTTAETTESAIVGGRVEAGYRATGFLDVNGIAVCSVTLIRSNVALTAAHCVHDDTAKVASVTFSGPSAIGFNYSIAKTIVHPQARVQGSDLQHDVALLLLTTTVEGITPAELGKVDAPSCAYRYVGFGRTTPGPAATQDSSSAASRRKSLTYCVDRFDAAELHGHALDGGNCFGDSGGPLYAEGTNRIYGVISRFDDGQPGDCKAGDYMVFTSVDAERSFIDGALGASEPCGADGLYCGGNGIFGDASTLFRCSNHALAPVRQCQRCVAHAAGQDDSCEDAAPAVACGDDGLYCGDDGVGGDRNVLYACKAHALLPVSACANGCATEPAGLDDHCE